MNITSTGIAVALAVVLGLALLFFGPSAFTFLFASDAGDAEATTTDIGTFGANAASNSATMENPAAGPLPTTFTVTDIAVGTGAEAKPGTTVTVNYIGALPDGTVFDASQNHGQPFTFTLGAGQVIKGWDQGLVGMKVGGKRQLVIPPDMGYGAAGAGNVIPPNATLIFQVELVSVGQ